MEFLSLLGKRADGKVRSRIREQFAFCSNLLVYSAILLFKKFLFTLPDEKLFNATKFTSSGRTSEPSIRGKCFPCIL